MPRSDDHAPLPTGSAASGTSGPVWRVVFYLIVTALLLMLVAAVRYGVIKLPGNPGTGSPVEAALPVTFAEAVPEKTSAGQGEEVKPRPEDRTMEASHADKAVERAVPDDQEQGVSRAEFERMQTNVMSMAETLSALQTRIKHETQETGAMRSHAEAQITKLAAFVQLSLAMQTGRDLAAPLKAMRSAAADDSAMMASIVRIEPFVTEGIASYAALKDEFMADEASARFALRKAAARTWKERLLAELNRLVSIRSLHGGTDGDEVLDAIDNDLTQHRLKAALSRADELPEAARDALKVWREKVKARLTVEEALDSIAAQFPVPDETGTKAEPEAEE